jgi:hypothetical protein
MKTRIFVRHKTLDSFINIQTLGCEGEEGSRKGLGVATLIFFLQIRFTWEKIKWKKKSPS